MFQLIPNERRLWPLAEKPKIKKETNILPPPDKWAFILRPALVIFVLAALAVFLIHSASAINQDLGRHFKLGEIIWQTGQVPHTNLFSYTNPDFPFINHHWLSEVIYYLLSLVIGTKGLIVFNAIIILAAFALVWRLSWKKNYFIFSTLAAILSAGLILERTDIRPETFGFLLLAIFLVILDKNKEKISWHFWLLVPLSALWVNLHISFVYGLVLIFFFFLDRLWRRRKAVYLLLKQKKAERYMAKIILLGFLAGLATLVNPNTWRGALYPLSIFSNFGYSIVENQSPFFLEGLTSDPIITFFRVAIIALICLFLLNWRRNRLFYILISLFCVIMSWSAIRNFPLLGLVILPILTDNFAAWCERTGQFFAKWASWRGMGVLRLLTIILIFAILSASIYAVATGRFYLKSMKPEQFGLLVPKGAEAAVDFLKQNSFQGPMFNNFDIGSYLIWRLYPDYKVFIDGRPESYPADFFRSVYVPMQEDGAVWQKYADEVYKINFVFFAHTDATPWAQSFIKQMAQRPGWAMVYVDPMVVIWARDNAANKELVAKYSLNESNLGQSIEKLLAVSNFFEATQLGSFFQAISFNDLAIRSFDRALELNKDAKQVLLAKALSHVAKKDLEQGKVCLEKAIKIDGGYAEAYLPLGAIYYEQGNFSEARRSWQKVLEIEPGNESARAYLDNMGLIPFKN
ncbi:MAG TPA: tetratricopeptide repeat protein [Candidatus Portnoybacteria bacterium]|nr:tetratricopeptide repeat protein [Candidatus Portnoybacteria bacterium]